MRRARQDQGDSPKFREVAGFDDDTLLAFQAAIARTRGTSTAERTTRDAGQPGVRLRMYTDLRQVLEEASSPAPSATSAGVVCV
ncbi:DUF6207 family protein [Streptomyces mirabilis]|uniref:DUF6207 family protein n=1 Tax=Streptomyces mirabilis TaxID=68239 RepID=UPI0033AC220A